MTTSINSLREPIPNWVKIHFLKRMKVHLTYNAWGEYHGLTLKNTGSEPW